MIPLDELNKQNQKTAELCRILAVLIEDRSLCETGVTCELFERFAESVREHFNLQDKTLYPKLLNHKDKSVNGVGLRCLNGSKEIKRIFKSYMNKWCRKGLHVRNHERFVAETKDIFRLLTERMQTEVELLYPLVRSVEANERKPVAMV